MTCSTCKGAIGRARLCLNTISIAMRGRAASSGAVRAVWCGCVFYPCSSARTRANCHHGPRSRSRRRRGLETRAERQCIVGWFRELSEARIPDLDETSLRTLGTLDREGTADACAEQFEVLCEQEMRANNHPSVNLETLGALAPVETKPGPARDKRPALVGPKGVNSV